NIAKLHQLQEIKDYHKESDIEIAIPYQSEGDDSDIVYRDYVRYQNEEKPDVGYQGYYNGVGSFEDEDAYNYQEYFGTFEGTKLSSFTMPDRLEYIASETFRECVPLHTFTIGKAYRGQINQTEFSQTSLSLYYLEIHDLTIDPENTSYILEDHLLYTRDKTVLCQAVCDQKYKQETLHIPREVSYIADGAFYMDPLYTNIVVDGDLEEIGIAAFAGSGINSFMAKGRIGKLKKGAFMHCKEMADWQCAAGVASMEKNVFLGSELLDRAETGGMFSWLQSFREMVSLRKLALFPSFLSILFS
ncbi:MAG: leucine-rich repeat domain-containing protein, partial [Lachnospiraceae bacterium]|nr:leucine-rich repeat domain-containing protein [Lachnospiraceae bacterium]